MTSTILVVDDEISGIETIMAILEGQGYQLESAANGYEALERAEQLTPDLILLDVMMPGMDGFEVCRQMRNSHRLAEVPIIILTALDDRTAMLHGLEAGADDFLTKPVDRQELRARIRTITRLNRYRSLLEQRDGLRKMASQIMQAQEQERQRISHDLHDELGQSLTAHMLNIQNLQSDLPMALKELQPRLEKLIAETNESLNHVRLLAQDLRPPILDTLGIQAAITGFCRDFGLRTHISTQVRVDPNLPKISDIYTVTLYRILQEALTNISKHAKANQVWVDLDQEGDTLQLTIQDNGQGISENDGSEKGIGVLGMQERLIMVGGTLSMHSNAGQGTVLTASLPIVS
ncbi:MAG TPA: response regulator [Longilinea sp.]|nr:response regulator [Longilinea sp.]